MKFRELNLSKEQRDNHARTLRMARELGLIYPAKERQRRKMDFLKISAGDNAL